MGNSFAVNDSPDVAKMDDLSVASPGPGISRIDMVIICGEDAGKENKEEVVAPQKIPTEAPATTQVKERETSFHQPSMYEVIGFSINQQLFVTFLKGES